MTAHINLSVRSMPITAPHATAEDLALELREVLQQVVDLQTRLRTSSVRGAHHALRCIQHVDLAFSEAAQHIEDPV